MPRAYLSYLRYKMVMRGVYRFMHTRHSVTGFAHVSVTAEPAAAFFVTAAPDVMDPRVWAVFGPAIEEGARAAIAAMGDRVPPHAVVIEEVIWTTVDTTPDAARCAAAIATWRALGRPEPGAVVVNVDGRWQVRFAPEG